MTKLARRLVQFVALVAVLLFAGTVVPRPFSAAADSGALERRILVLSNPIHSDIAIAIDPAILARFSKLAEAGLPVDLSGARYLVFGWGSRAFYIETPTWGDLKPGPLFTALTWDQSVMHVGVAGDLGSGPEPVRDFRVTDAQFERLLTFIEQSFVQGADGPLAIPGAAYGDFDQFFEAKGPFTALLGCNTWTAAALREAGLRTGWWTPIPQTLGLSLDLLN
jgi:uncharacterized protein (TIGR02117 family)